MAEKHLMLTRCIIACVGYLMQVSNACSSQIADLSMAGWPQCAGDGTARGAGRAIAGSTGARDRSMAAESVIAIRCDSAGGDGCGVVVVLAGRFFAGARAASACRLARLDPVPVSGALVLALYVDGVGTLAFCTCWTICTMLGRLLSARESGGSSLASKWFARPF